MRICASHVTLDTKYTCYQCRKNIKFIPKTVYFGVYTLSLIEWVSLRSLLWDKYGNDLQTTKFRAHKAISKTSVKDDSNATNFNNHGGKMPNQTYSFYHQSIYLLRYVNFAIWSSTEIGEMVTIRELISVNESNLPSKRRYVRALGLGLNKGN